jgi:hypothetical protein
LITEHYGASDADLSTERFTYLATYAAESLIKNAGYIGLLGDLEDELLLRLGESYRRLGNDAHAELLEESLKTLPNYPPIPTKEHREATLDSWEYGEKCDPTEPVFDRFTSIDDTAQDRLRYAVANAITS